MRNTVLALVGLSLGVFGATGAGAGGDALIIGNANYDRLQTLFGAARVAAAEDGLRDQGFDVEAVTDADASEMRNAFGRFIAGIAEGEEPLVVILAGVFAHDTGGAYLLPVDDQSGADPARFLIDALPLDPVLTVLAQHPGRAFLVLGESVSDEDLGPYLSAGPGRLDIPQGVTVISGPGPDIARFAARDMLRPGRNLASATRRFELSLSGYAPGDHVLLRPEDVIAEGDADPDAAAQVFPDPDQVAAAEAAAKAADDAAWRLAQQADSAEGYRTYLEGFPEGLRAAAARQRLSAIEEEPFYRQRRAEEALELSRDARREIQRDLSILGYNTRGIDGIFGAGTRRAIADWQKADGRTASGYLDQPQITRLDDQARARADALEAEARQRQAAQERRDRTMWDTVERRGDEASIRAYLEEFPEGIYATRARDLLAAIEEQREGQAAVQDRRAWRRAREVDTIEAYRGYLADRPGGAFAGEAQARINELTRNLEQERAAARAQAEEQALGLNIVARRLAEARLDGLGLRPGKVDGQFDKDTRKAIRRYQEARNLRVSGYLDQDTVVRLLADGILGR